jgi:hypothetical protein
VVHIFYKFVSCFRVYPTIRIIIASNTLKKKSHGYIAYRIAVFLQYNNIISVTINRGKVQQILGKLSEIYQLLFHKMYRIQIYMNTKSFHIFLFAIITYTIIIICGIFCVTDDNLSSTNMYLVFSQTMSVFCKCTAILYFENLVLLLRNKFRYVHSVLESSSLIPCKITYLNDRNTNYMIPIENYKCTMKPSIKEMRAKFISLRRKNFPNLRIIYRQLPDVALLMNSSYGFSLLCFTFWISITIISGADYVIQMKHTHINFYIFLSVRIYLLCCSNDNYGSVLQSCCQ